MKTISVVSGKTLLALAVQQYKSLEGVVALAQLNGLSITAAPATGTQLQVDDSLKFQVPKKQKAVLPSPMNRPMVISDGGQSLFDVAVQRHGGLTGVFVLAQLNGLSITALLAPGQILQVQEAAVVNQVLAKEILATGLVINNSRQKIQAAEAETDGFDYTLDFDLH